MRDVLNLILPLFWNYCASLLLILKNPFAAFASRARDPRFFKDSVLFLAVSALLSALIATILTMPDILSYTAIIFTAINYSAPVLLIAVAIYLTWRVFGYRGPAGTILMPFIYAGSSLLFFTTALSIFFFGALKVFTPATYDLVVAAFHACAPGSENRVDGVIGSANIGFVVTAEGPTPPAALAFMVIYAAVALYFVVSAAFGAYRAAVLSHPLPGAPLRLTRALVAVASAVVAVGLAELFSASMSGLNVCE